ncbi:MAG: uncharacterized protein H6Q05_432 [Acidobacteria bacterium]|nr:uncharacterized protein [Acidobacteriota bacterium]
MPYQPIIDFAALLAPIPGENPSGTNLLYSGLHDQIREARRADDTLAQGDWKRDQKVSEWPLVFNLATNALASQTKDLQLAAWLTEALVNLHGFSGLADGLQLLRGLLEKFWDTLYPEIDEGDLEARANAVGLLNRPSFAGAVQGIKITGNPVGPNYSYIEYKDSTRFDIPENLETLEFQEKERLTALKQQAVEERKITSQEWRTAKGASNRAFYEDLNKLLQLCWDECKALDTLMDEKFQRQTPGLSDFRKGLESVRSTVEIILKEKRLLEPDPVEATVDGSAEAGAGGGGARSAGPAGTRADALRRLGEVAEFFRATEPHSPVSYLLQRAIRWGQIPLEEWLDEVVKDQAVLAQIRETLGLKPGNQ